MSFQSLRNLAFLGRPAPGGFTFGSVGTLFEHADADLGITLNGSDVQQWADQAAEGNDFSQGTPAKQPSYNAIDADFNNHASVQFNGVNELLVTSAFTGGVVAQPNTFFLVIRSLSAATRKIFDGIATTDRQVYEVFPNEHSIWAGTALINTIPVDTLAAHIVVIRVNGASTEGFVDGAGTAWTGNPGSNSFGGFTLGARFNDTNHGNFKLGMLLGYRNSLSNASINLVSNELSTIFNLPWTDI